MSVICNPDFINFYDLLDYPYIFMAGLRPIPNKRKIFLNLAKFDKITLEKKKLSQPLFTNFM